jgi:hypothetical protein
MAASFESAFEPPNKSLDASGKTRDEGGGLRDEDKKQRVTFIPHPSALIPCFRAARSTLTLCRNLLRLPSRRNLNEFPLRSVAIGSVGGNGTFGRAQFPVTNHSSCLLSLV